MEILSFTYNQLQKTILGLEKLANVTPQKHIFIEICESLNWSLLDDDSIVMRFNTPVGFTLFVDLYDSNYVAGGFVPLYFLDFDEFEGNTKKCEESKKFFDKKYLEIVSSTKSQLGNPETIIIENEPHQQCSVWRKETAFIFVLQGADDIEGLDIRLWIEYFYENEDLPDSQIFDWLCKRHLSKM